MKKTIFALSALAILSGCQSTQEVTPMPEQAYVDYSYSLAVNNSCVDQGITTPEEEMAYGNIMASGLRTWQQVDYDKVNRYTKDQYSALGYATEDDCKKLEEWVFRLNDELYEQQHQPAKQRSQPNASGLAEISNALQQLGQASMQAGNQALQQSNSFSVPTVTPVIKPKGTYYEAMPNPMNNTNSHQSLVGSTTSSSGRTVCKYSMGATRVLNYGNTICPISIN